MDQEALLKQFVGRWHGTGRGAYPTIAPFDYTEDLAIIATHKPTILQYDVRTIKSLPDGTRAPSHLELGFIRLRDDGSIEWANVQSGGRVEVLVGRIESRDGGILVALKPSLLGNDERMKDSARVFTLTGDILEYQQDMALVNVPGLQFHTTATLYRLPTTMT